MVAATVGHCLRIDNLAAADAHDLCDLLGGDDAFEVAVLGDGYGGTMGAERAVEIRNRKSSRLCLLVPSEIGESSSSSLGNSFAVFDLEAAMAEAIQAMVTGLPEDVRAAVQAAISVSGE